MIVQKFVKLVGHGLPSFPWHLNDWKECLDCSFDPLTILLESVTNRRSHIAVATPVKEA